MPAVPGGTCIGMLTLALPSEPTLKLLLVVKGVAAWAELGIKIKAGRTIKHSINIQGITLVDVVLLNALFNIDACIMYNPLVLLFHLLVIV